LLYLLVRNQAEERRLSKVDGQSLAQRVVKYGLARRVLEIGEDDRVLLRESRRPMKVNVPRDRERQHNCRCSAKNDLPAFRRRGREAGRQRRARVPSQALKVCANLRRVLVAELAV